MNKYCGNTSSSMKKAKMLYLYGASKKAVSPIIGARRYKQMLTNIRSNTLAANYIHSLI